MLKKMSKKLTEKSHPHRQSPPPAGSSVTEQTGSQETGRKKSSQKTETK